MHKTHTDFGCLFFRASGANHNKMDVDQENVMQFALISTFCENVRACEYSQKKHERQLTSPKEVKLQQDGECSATLWHTKLIEILKSCFVSSVQCVWPRGKQQENTIHFSGHGHWFNGNQAVYTAAAAATTILHKHFSDKNKFFRASRNTRYCTVEIGSRILDAYNFSNEDNHRPMNIVCVCVWLCEILIAIIKLYNIKSPNLR